jgi:RNase adaptor protein for sRNA GlmZ degradation
MASWSSSSWHQPEYSQAEVVKPEFREKGTGSRVSESGRRVLDSMYSPGGGSQLAADQTRTHKEEAMQQSTDMAHKRIVIRSRGFRYEAISGKPCHFVDATQLFDPDVGRDFSGLHFQVMQAVAKHECFDPIMKKIKTFIIQEATKNTKVMYLDICCAKGKHRSVAMAAIVCCMLSDHCAAVSDYVIDTHHIAQNRWGRCGNNCVGCTSRTADQEKLMERIAAKWVHF